MGESVIPGTSILIDLCTRCHLVWYDRDEFEATTASAAIDPELSVDLATRKSLALAKIELQSDLEKMQTSFQPPSTPKELVLALLGLPVEEPHSLMRRPWATWLTSVAILVASVLGFFNLELAAQAFGFVPSDALRWGGATLITSFFLHGNFLHLLSNLYFLAVFGDNVEDRLGHARLLAVLFGSTLCGNFLSLLISGGSSATIPHIGASGGIAGVLSFYAFRFPHSRIGIFFFFRLLKLPAIFLIGIWLLTQVMGTLVQASGSTFVDYAAHLGGAIAGFCFWILWRTR